MSPADVDRIFLKDIEILSTNPQKGIHAVGPDCENFSLVTGPEVLKIDSEEILARRIHALVIAQHLPRWP